jgi:hypothetical protein
MANYGPTKKPWKWKKLIPSGSRFSALYYFDAAGRCWGLSPLATTTSASYATPATILHFSLLPQQLQHTIHYYFVYLQYQCLPLPARHNKNIDLLLSGRQTLLFPMYSWKIPICIGRKQSGSRLWDTMKCLFRDNIQQIDCKNHSNTLSGVNAFKPDITNPRVYRCEISSSGKMSTWLPPALCLLNTTFLNTYFYHCRIFPTLINTNIVKLITSNISLYLTTADNKIFCIQNQLYLDYKTRIIFHFLRKLCNN